MTAPVPRDARAADARTRFLRAIADRVPLDRVAEVHVFPAMRQGNVETGVAVVAVVIDDERDGDEAAATESGESAVAGQPAAPEGDGQVTLFPDEGEAGGEGAERVAGAAADDDAVADEARGAPPQHHDTSPADPLPHPEPAPRTVPTRVARRLTIFSARYRVVLKGPDRGKWDVDVRAEADAPLLTVDAVVRGVLRRSPDSEEPERLLGEQFRALVEPPVPGAPASPAS